MSWPDARSTSDYYQVANYLCAFAYVPSPLGLPAKLSSAPLPCMPWLGAIWDPAQIFPCTTTTPGFLVMYKSPGCPEQIWEQDGPLGLASPSHHCPCTSKAMGYNGLPLSTCPAQAQPMSSCSPREQGIICFQSCHIPTPTVKRAILGTHQASSGPPNLRPRADSSSRSTLCPFHHGPVTLPTPLPPARAAELPGARASYGVGRPAGLPGASAAAPA